MKNTQNQFQEAVQYLYNFVPKTNMKKFPGEVGLQRTKTLLNLLGDPQEKIKVVHIAGTSGKGSTAIVMSTLLQNHGFKVGLHVKPHITDIRERFQINNTLISEELFISYLEDVKKAIAVMPKNAGMPTYFEVIVSLAFYIFYKESVDYAVVETGVGGQFDGSNTINNPDKLVLLTSIGYDHMAILGDTLEEIAYQKAMIMQSGNQAFSIDQPPEVKKVFQKVANKNNSSLEFITPRNNFKVKKIMETHTVFDFCYGSSIWNDLELSLPGDYQVENTAVALAGLLYIGKKDRFEVQQSLVRSTLKHIHFPGRFEIRTVHSKKVIIDGAHNTQKMEAFLSNLKIIYPQTKYTFLVGFKEGKEIESMVSMILPLAKKIYVTHFFNDTVDFVAMSEKPEVVADVILRQGFREVCIEKDPLSNLGTIIDETEGILVITGSLYLIADMRQALRKL